MTTIIGWDAAVDPRNNALVLATLEQRSRAESMLSVDDLSRPRTTPDLIETIVSWVQSSAHAVICVDSPLGWPAAMGRSLNRHRAGGRVSAEAEFLFRRHTDRDIRKRVGKTPLDIGADRIARTALAVLNTIGAVADALSAERQIAIAVEREAISAAVAGPSIALLETYPAGWFASERIRTRGYRPPQAVATRSALLSAAKEAFFRNGVTLSSRIADEEYVERADDLDALVCTFAGVDALSGVAPGPPVDLHDDVAIEGWIWCKGAV